MQMSFKSFPFHRYLIIIFVFNDPGGYYTQGIYVEGYIVFVFPFVCSYFHPVRSSNSSGVYLTNHSSECIHIWTIGTLEGRLSFHDS